MVALAASDSVSSSFWKGHRFAGLDSPAMNEVVHSTESDPYKPAHLDAFKKSIGQALADNLNRNVRKASEADDETASKWLLACDASCRQAALHSPPRSIRPNSRTSGGEAGFTEHSGVLFGAHARRVGFVQPERE